MSLQKKLCQDIQKVKSNKYTNDTFEEARDAAEKLTKALNGGTSKAAMLGMLEALWCEHRYLQNEAIIVMLAALANLPSATGTDARNEFGISLCLKIREALADELYGWIVKGEGI